MTLSRRQSEAVSYVEFSPVVCFLLGATVLLPIAPESRLTLFDPVACVLILRYWRAIQTLFKPAIALLVLSIAAMAASAYINGSDPRALVGRGYQPVALLIELMGYWILIAGSNDKGRAALVLGVMLGICTHYFHPNDLRVLDEPIKFLLGIPLGAALLALYTLAVPRASASMAIVVLLMIAYALFCFVMGSRSIGGVYFASALLVAIVGFVRVPASYAKFAPLFIMVAGLVGYGLTELYTMLALQGFFGDRAAGIAAFQSSFGSILLGGRPEIIVNLSGVRDAPLLGVGILNYPSLYVYEMINLSVYSQQDVLDLSNILYHSALFATAFESGLIAALFWAFLLYTAIFAVPLLTVLPASHRSYVAPLILIAIWHMLYSPPIPYNRYVMSIGLGFVFFICDTWRRQRRAEQPPPSLYAAVPGTA